MIDLHTHILPGVDDGSPSMEESLQMAAIAARRGTAVIVATPHTNRGGMQHRRYENFYSEALLTSFQMLRNRVKRERIPIRLRLGQEVFATEDIYEKIKNRAVIGLNDSKYLLTEFSFGVEPEEAQWYLNEVKRAGKIPLIAHPERYECVMENPQLVINWIRQGAFAQVNAGSLLGRFGRRQQQTVWQLLREDAIYCVSSDAHDSHMRIPDLFEARMMLERQAGKGIARRLLHDNPGNILQSVAEEESRK